MAGSGIGWLARKGFQARASAINDQAIDKREDAKAKVALIRREIALERKLATLNMKTVAETALVAIRLPMDVPTIDVEQLPTDLGLAWQKIEKSEFALSFADRSTKFTEEGKTREAQAFRAANMAMKGGHPVIAGAAAGYAMAAKGAAEHKAAVHHLASTEGWAAELVEQAEDHARKVRDGIHEVRGHFDAITPHMQRLQEHPDDEATRRGAVLFLTIAHDQFARWASIDGLDGEESE